MLFTQRFPSLDLNSPRRDRGLHIIRRLRNGFDWYTDCTQCPFCRCRTVFLAQHWSTQASGGGCPDKSVQAMQRESRCVTCGSHWSVSWCLTVYNNWSSARSSLRRNGHVPRTSRGVLRGTWQHAYYSEATCGPTSALDRAGSQRTLTERTATLRRMRLRPSSECTQCCSAVPTDCSYSQCVRTGCVASTIYGLGFRPRRHSGAVPSLQHRRAG